MSGFEVHPEKKPEPAAASGQPLEDLFTRVASLWLWSVFFVITSGLSVSFLSTLGPILNPLLTSGMMGRGGFSYSPPSGMMGRGGFSNSPLFSDLFVYVLPVIHLGGMIANVGSWAFLYLYFTVYLLPAVILRDPRGVDDRRRRIAAAALRRTYLLTITAGIARMLPELLLFLAPVLSRWSSF